MNGRAEARRQIRLTLAAIRAIQGTGDKRMLSLVDDLRRQVLLMLVENGRIDADLLRSLRSRLPQIMDDFNKRFVDVMSENQRRVFVKGIQMVDRAVKATGAMIGVPYLDETILSELSTYNADLIRGVTDQARQRIAAEVSLSVMGQKPMSDVMDSIGRNLTSPSIFSSIRDRARAIYITEMHRVQNAATARRIGQLGKQIDDLDKQWLHSHRGLPRWNHLVLDGIQVRAGDKFSLVGRDKVTYRVDAPHDPLLPASETVNCRCTLIPVVRRFQVAKPVPPTPAPPPKVTPPLPGAGSVEEAGALAWLEKRPLLKPKTKGWENELKNPLPVVRETKTAVEWRKLPQATKDAIVKGQENTRLPLTSLVTDQKEITKSKVADMIRSKIDLEKNPPIGVQMDDGRVMIVDGNNRVAVAMARGDVDIPVKIVSPGMAVAPVARPPVASGNWSVVTNHLRSGPNLPKQTLDSMNEILERATEIFPQTEVRSIDWFTPRDLSRPGRKTWSGYCAGMGVIRLRPRANILETKVQLQRQQTSRWWSRTDPVYSGYEATLAHELGHTVFTRHDYWLYGPRRGERAALQLAIDRLHREHKKLGKAGSPTRKQLIDDGHFVSDYATTNSDEFVAEIVRTYLLTADRGGRNRFVKSVIDLLKEYHRNVPAQRFAIQKGE